MNEDQVDEYLDIAVDSWATKHSLAFLVRPDKKGVETLLIYVSDATPAREAFFWNTHRM